jgi:hypothetical protein
VGKSANSLDGSVRSVSADGDARSALPRAHQEWTTATSGQAGVLDAPGAVLAAAPQMTKREELRLREMAKPPRCAFCDATGDLLTCDWLVPRFVRVQYSDLHVGDRVRRANDRCEGRTSATVTELELRAPEPFRVEILLPGKRGLKRFVVQPGSPVQVLGVGQCDQWCCPLHRVERGEVFFPAYCRDHWMAWQEVA